MTTTAAHLLVRRATHTDRLARALVALALAGVVALWVLAAASVSSPRGAPATGARIALVVDAGGRPRAALDRARAMAGPKVAIRVPRTAAEAAADVRYFAAQGYARVVVAGPLATGAARAAAPAYPRTRFAARRVPR